MQATFTPFEEHSLSNEKYVQYLTIFEEVPRYRETLSLEARVLYGFLKDRMIYFSKLGESLVDEKGQVYIYMSQEEMKFHICKSSNDKIAKVLYELESVGLIRQEQQGNYFKQGHVLKKLPNRIYVGQVSLIAGVDFIEKSKWKKDGTLTIDPFKANGELTKEAVERFMDTHDINELKLIRPVVPKNGSTGKSPSDTVVPKNGSTRNLERTTFINSKSAQKSQSEAVVPKNGTLLINTNNDTNIDTNKDTSRKLDAKIENESLAHKTVIDWFKENMNRTFITENTVSLICLFNDIEMIKKMIDTIYEEKRRVENYRYSEDRKLGLKTKLNRIKGEVFRYELEQTVKRFISQYKIQSGKNKIKNVANYFRAVMKNFWESCLINQDYYGQQLLYDASSCQYVDPFKNLHFGSKQERFEYVYGKKRPYHNGNPMNELTSSKKNLNRNEELEIQEIGSIQNTYSKKTCPDPSIRSIRSNEHSMNNNTTKLARTEIIPEHIAHPEKFEVKHTPEFLRQAELSLKELLKTITETEKEELKNLRKLDEKGLLLATC